MSLRTSHRVLIASAIATSAAVVGVPATGAPYVTVPRLSASAGIQGAPITPVDQDLAQQSMEAANRVLIKYPDLNAGFTWDASSSTLYANLAGAGAVDGNVRNQVSADMIAAASEATGVRFVVRDAVLSRSEMQDLIKQVSDTRNDWAGQDADRIVKFGGDPVTGTVRIGVSGDPTAVQRAGFERFGDRITVTTSSPLRPLASRYNDTSPWTAGNAIWKTQSASRSLGNADCTQGFSWRSGGVSYASTAAHCRGSSWYHISTTQRIGQVAGTYWGSPYGNTDTELVAITSGSLDNTMWVGGLNTTDVRSVVDADNVAYVTGFNVCSSGANGGMACGTTYDAYASDTYDGHTVNNLTCATLYSGEAIPGDSGAPVLSTHVDGTVKAWGQVATGNYLEFCFVKVYEISLATGRSLVVS